MIETKKIIEAAERHLEGSDMFVVECTSTPGNEIELTIDSDTSVGIDACAELSRAVEAQFDRDEEDFSLTVMSAGIGSGLKSLRQYRKLAGKSAEVLLTSGVKILAKLEEVTDEGITLSYEEKQAVEGKKEETVGESHARLPLRSDQVHEGVAGFQVTIKNQIKHTMDNLNLISNFAEFKELKNIDKSTMIGVLEDVFRHALQKQYETDENFDVIINPEKGDLEIWRNRTVVEDDAVEDPNAQISVSEVKAIDPTYEIGDEYADEIKLSSFGRRAVLSLRQNLASRILDLEKASLYEKYSEKVGDIVTGEVYQVWKKEVLILDDEENELILPKAEQIPNDFYRKGDTIKAIVKSVEMNNNQPRIILSRTANQFLERLFEQEVPEIFDGLITIKKIVRIPGERAKVAVESYDERIDPVGACVGMKGSRIYSIVKELRNENIDVVNYTANPTLMIQRSLNPAKVSSITIDEEKMTASVYLKPDQVSLAIGKGGLNIRLSKMLTGYDIDVYREVEEEDVALTEFADEIDGWVIDALKAAGCDTAKSVLELPVEEIAARADLELEQAQKVVEILKAEFE